MEIKIYDRVLLTDGCEASIVEIFEEGKFFLADIDKAGDTYTEELSVDRIEKIVEPGKVKMTEEAIKFIVSRVIDNAFDAAEEAKENGDDFYKGRKLAYYEILDTIKNELIVRDADLKEFGLDVNLEEVFL